MIRINLLPFRAARKQENIRRQISIYLLSLLLMFVIMGYVYIQKSGELGDLKTREGQLKKDLASYAEIIKEINDLKQQTKQNKSNMEVIRGLEKKKAGPVRLLDEIATAVPKNRLWLRSLAEKAGMLNLKGTAKNNDTVALFMTNLEKAEHIISVDLSSTKLKSITKDKEKMQLTDFELSCKTYTYKEKPGKSAGKAGRRR